MGVVIAISKNLYRKKTPCYWFRDALRADWVEDIGDATIYDEGSPAYGTLSQEEYLVPAEYDSEGVTRRIG